MGVVSLTVLEPQSHSKEPVLLTVTYFPPSLPQQSLSLGFGSCAADTSVGTGSKALCCEVVVFCDVLHLLQIRVSLMRAEDEYAECI